MVSVLVRDSLSSVRPGSDGSGSSVEDEPLPVVSGIVVPDSESELVTSDVFFPVESHSPVSSVLDLELDSVSEWLVWPVDSSSVKIPSLGSAVVAVPPVGVHMVSVVRSVDHKAEVSVVPDTSSVTSPVADLLVKVASPRSNDTSHTLVHSVAIPS